jgi:hypothetical protein
MKRFYWMFSCLFFISLPLVLSVYAISCTKQVIQNPHETEWSSKQEPLLIAANPSHQSDTYAQAEALFKEKKYDNVIRLLLGPAQAEPISSKLNILLAKAQVEKCAILKAKGDKSYKALLSQPYQIGQRFHKLDKSLPEPYYIVAKILLIKNSTYRAIRTIKKALYFSPNNADYLLVMADACGTYAQDPRNSESGNVEKFFSLAIYNYKKAIEIKKGDEEFKASVEKKIKEISEKMKE